MQTVNDSSADEAVAGAVADKGAVAVRAAVPLGHRLVLRPEYEIEGVTVAEGYDTGRDPRGCDQRDPSADGGIDAAAGDVNNRPAHAGVKLPRLRDFFFYFFQFQIIGAVIFAHMLQTVAAQFDQPRGAFGQSDEKRFF